MNNLKIKKLIIVSFLVSLSAYSVYRIFKYLYANEQVHPVAQLSQVIFLIAGMLCVIFLLIYFVILVRNKIGNKKL